MKKVLFVVPKGYKSIGGMALPITQYHDAIREVAQVDFIEVGYHPSTSDFADLSANGDYDVALVYGLNQAYGLSKHYLLKHTGILKTVALLIDSESLYAYSMLNNATTKDVKYRIKMFLKKTLYNYKENYCLNKYNEVVYVSSVDKEFVEKLFPNHKATITVIENGVSISNRLPQKQHIRNMLKLGFFSTFTPAVVEENLKPIVEVLMPAIVQHYPETKLVVAGRGMGEELRSYLANFKYVEYVGPVKELSDFYSIIDIVIPVTLKPNGILNKVLEAWAYSKTVVAYDYNFFSFSDANRGIHYLCGKDLGEISRIINDIIEGKYDIDEIGNSARELIEKNYTWKSKQEKLIGLLLA